VSEETTWLTPAEVEEYTAKKRWAAQCRALASMGVPFTPNAVGRPLVERAVVCKSQAKPRKKAEPNWGAIRRRAA
jgi:hypothetical protein